MALVTEGMLVDRFMQGTDVLPTLIDSGFVTLWRGLVQLQYNLLVDQAGVTVVFVQGDPFPGPDARAAMFASIAHQRLLPVSVEYNHNRLNGLEGNLRFRAAHDLAHWFCDQDDAYGTEQRCDFSLPGETRVMHWQGRSLVAILKRQGQYTPEREELIYRVAFSEIVLRVAVYCQTPSYFEDKVVLVPMQMIDDWCGQLGLAPLASASPARSR